MKIQTVLSIDRYNLLVCHYSGNLYRLSIADSEKTVCSFDGIYPSLKTAIERGKSIIQNLQCLS